MSSLSHIVEPEALLMTWQPTDEASTNRTRRIIGEVRRDPHGTRELVFQYLDGTADWECAQAEGFKGYPAFHLESAGRIFASGVRDSLMRRLPPTSREDFPEFLRRHLLPVPFPYSELALLGYTGAKLPGDGFALVPIFPDDQLPCEYILELAGVRHVFKGDVGSLRVGDPVEFHADRGNEVEAEAISVHHPLGKLGYVNRAMLPTFHRWIAQGKLSGRVERINGRPDRPLVYVKVCASV